MNLHEYSINVKRGAIVNIFPFFDCHVGSANCDMKKLEENIDWCKKKGAYVLFGGDQIDAINFSDKRFDYDNLAEFSQKGLSRVVSVQVEKFVKMFKPLKGRIIGLLSGNHEDKIKSVYHFDPSYEICKGLECKFLGYSAMIRLTMAQSNLNINKCVIFAHHGCGAGTAGAQVNKIQNIANDFEADIYLMGHSHQKICSQSERLEMSDKGSLHIRARKRVFAICGTYLKTYEQGQMGYGEKKLFRPTSTGGVKITIEPFKRIYVNGKELCGRPHIHVSE